MRSRCFLVFALVIGHAGMSAAAEFSLNAAQIEEAAGAKGTLNVEEGVFKVAYPRTDVKITVDGTTLPPFMGLTSWAAFMSGMSKPAMVMGDFVLFQDEVNPAMSAALESGLSVTALHNHFLYDEPKVYFMHIGGEGEAVKLAAAVKKIQDTVRSIRAASPAIARGFGAQPLPQRSAISAAPLEQLLGKGQTKDGMFKVVVGRTTHMACGCPVGKEMGVNTWAAFYGSDEHALVDGDFAVFEGELQGVLKSLRRSGINVVAIHSHMETDNPKVLFLHYWGIGPATDLGKVLQTALELTRNDRPAS
jgi:hypothetical protein